MSLTPPNVIWTEDDKGQFRVPSSRHLSCIPHAPHHPDRHSRIIGAWGNGGVGTVYEAAPDQPDRAVDRRSCFACCRRQLRALLQLAKARISSQDVHLQLHLDEGQVQRTLLEHADIDASTGDRVRD